MYCAKLDKLALCSNSLEDYTAGMNRCIQRIDQCISSLNHLDGLEQECTQLADCKERLWKEKNGMKLMADGLDLIAMNYHYCEQQISGQYNKIRSN